jgi:hypothetical protein
MTLPVGSKAHATAYVYQMLITAKLHAGTTYETGSMLHAHVGYVIPSKSKHVFSLCVFRRKKVDDALNDNASQLG